ncbi:MAG: NAD-dependent epimerase/dehydratase family protein [Spirochaetota bacterium]
MKKALVLGAGGFIGGHLVKKLKQEDFWVRGVDLNENLYSESQTDDFLLGDLRKQEFVTSVFDQEYHEIYQLAADMGGAGYIFTKNHDAEIMHNSSLINLHVLETIRKQSSCKKIFYSSSACIYPQYNQNDPNNPNCIESSAYPAAPDSEYGWEKLFSERLYLAYAEQYGLQVRIARFHNIFGPEGTWKGGREKAPAAICRKVAEANENGTVKIWGDGKQTRSFLYIDECLQGIRRLMDSNFIGPVNVGSSTMISINNLAKLIIDISQKKLSIRNIDGPQGVRGRTSDNTLLYEKLNWRPSGTLKDGLQKTYQWIEQQVMTQSCLQES